MIEKTVEEMYRADEENKFLEVTYQNGDKELLSSRDFASGAMIENVVVSGKKLAIKSEIAGKGRGVRAHPTCSIHPPRVPQGEQGPPEHQNPDDWARISTRASGSSTCERCWRPSTTGGRSIERMGTGQYLWTRVQAALGTAPARNGRRPDPATGVLGSIRGSDEGLRRGDRVRHPSRRWRHESVASSSLLVNAYVSDLARVGWDFEDEMPGNNHGFAREGALPPEIETHLVNAVLTNGAGLLRRSRSPGNSPLRIRQPGGGSLRQGR